MMSSIDLASSSSGAASAQRTASLNLGQPSQSNVRYASHVPCSGSPAPHPQQIGYAPSSSTPPASSEAGRLNTEQLVLDFFFKVTEVVLHSRVHLPSEPSHNTQINRRVRFNLDVEEVPHIRAAMTAWREDVHLPLTIDVYFDGDNDQRVLLERWSVVYTYGLSAVTDPFDNAPDFHGRRHSSTRIGGSAKSYATAGSSRDVLQILREVLKKFTIQLRALHCFMRLLPAHRFFRQSYPSTLSYEFSSCEEAQLASGFEAGVATNQYSFPPINTPFGFVKVATVYRRDCSALERRRKKASKDFIQENFIIQDYVPASPELAPAPPPSNRPAASPSSPLMIPPSSFASPMRRQVEEEEEMDRRRRSSPEIGVNDSDIQEAEYGRGLVSPRRSKQHTSQPMAIPQQVKSPTVVMSLEDHLPDTEDPSDGGTTSKPVPIMQQHPHSYGDPSRIRTLGANPNVTPAPYGYRNVAIERGQTPPLPGQQLSTSSGYSGYNGGGSYQDQSGTMGSQHPLSTPPRHPHSVLTPRTSSMRTSFVSTSSSAPGRKANDFGYRASLENFSLDASSPGHSHHHPSDSPLGRAQTFHFDGKASRSSFDSQRSVTPDLPEETSSFRSTGSTRNSTSGSSPQLTPPFAADVAPGTAVPPTSTTALVLRHASREEHELRPSFETSPPFQANPSELLSTSPGYSHSKHYQALRRGSSSSARDGTTPTDLALTRTGSFRSTSGSGSILAGFAFTGTSPMGSNRALIDTKSPAFSIDIVENGVGIWGISPDSGESFTMSIGASTRRRYLSSGDQGTGGEYEKDEAQPSSVHDENELFMLPFAVGDEGEKLSTATTVTATSSLGDRTSSFTGQTETAWDTASVGSFLQQLKNAPRLQHQDPTLASPVLTGSADPRARASLFDDELESFRTLRNELARVL